MASFAQMTTMDIWYARLDQDELQTAMSSAVAGVAKGEKTAKKKEKADRREKAPKKKEKTAKKDERQAGSQEKMAKKAQRRAEKNLAKARTRDSLQALSKLGERVNGSYQIISQPPLVIPVGTWPPPTACPPQR